MMLEINLLPQEGQRSQVTSLQNIYRMPIIWVIGGLVLLHILFSFSVTQFRSFRLSKLNQKLEQLRPQQQERQALQERVNLLRAEESAFQGLGAGTTYLSQRLFALAEAAPKAIWYSELVLDSREGMILRGYAIAQKGIEMSQIGQLVQSLSQSGGFVEDFGAVKIDSIKRTDDEGVEVVEFMLVSGKEELAEE